MVSAEPYRNAVSLLSTVANSKPSVKPVYSWTLPYISRPNPATRALNQVSVQRLDCGAECELALTTVSAIPRDLRLAMTPLHELLADVSAGSSTPANDVFDLSIIREEWLRSRIQEHYWSHVSDEQKTTLR